jgi:hypothetical protein
MRGPFSRRQALAALAAAGSGLAFSRDAAADTAARLAAIQADDGAAGAPAGPPQLPRLLDGYRARPPWKVAGVDYAVGIPAGTTLADWKTLDLPDVALHDTWVRVSARNFVLDGVDFSTHGGAHLAIDDAATGTVRNCKFGGEGYKSLGTGIIDSSSPDLTVRNCVFDAAGAGNSACILFIRGTGKITLLYNAFDNFPNRIIELLKGGTVDYRFNLIGEGAMQPGAHLNYLEFEGGTATPVVAFNTSAQTFRAPSGGEGFQFYFNVGGTMADPICANNTMIAKGGRGAAVMSYLLHGSVYQNGIHTALVGTGLITDNYIDVSSGYGPFYADSFPGWHVGRNVDMVSGRILPPPR